MEQTNICRFIPRHNDYDAIHTINFVLETKRQNYNGLKSSTAYRIHLVQAGEGVLHMPGKEYHLSSGDVFFCLPATPYAIESLKDFRYIYITYIGTRANMIMDRLKINGHNCLFHGFSELMPVWERGLGVSSEAVDIMSESVLLYTFAVMGEQYFEKTGGEKKVINTVSLIKKYIDDNFSDTGLSLDRISRELSYNKKYISTVFKSTLGIGLSEYINTVRVQHACTLMEQGLTSVKDIAFLCGFKDPMYFSRVFKKKMCQSPKGHMDGLQY